MKNTMFCVLYFFEDIYSFQRRWGGGIPSCLSSVFIEGENESGRSRCQRHARHVKVMWGVCSDLIGSRTLITQNKDTFQSCSLLTHHLSLLQLYSNVQH